MLCKIADLIIEIPEAGGMAPRCKEYLYEGNDGADIIIRTEYYSGEDLGKHANESYIAYMESGRQFYSQLYRYNGMILHSSAVSYQNKAYLFSGPCGMGKSTHTRIWKETFGAEAQVFNDDKPALRYIDGKWYAYGTPWCGKDGINQNKKVPLAGICFLKQAQNNKIRRLSSQEAMKKILSQTYLRKLNIDQVVCLTMQVDSLVRCIPVFELENRPEPQAALLSYETMRQTAEELKL